MHYIIVIIDRDSNARSTTLEASMHYIIVIIDRDSNARSTTLEASMHYIIVIIDALIVVNLLFNVKFDN
jgi:hypothetical protein